MSAAYQHNSTMVAAKILFCASWLKLWDMALDLGPCGTNAQQALYHSLTIPFIGKSPCCIYVAEDIPSYFLHFIDQHTPIESPECVINTYSLAEKSCDIFNSAKYVKLVCYIRTLIIIILLLEWNLSLTLSPATSQYCTNRTPLERAKSHFCTTSIGIFYCASCLVAFTFQRLLLFYHIFSHSFLF